MSEVVEFAPHRKVSQFPTASSSKTTPTSPPAPVFFDRHELSQIFSVYSRKVIAGEWRDYAIERDDRSAVFAVYQRSWDHPAYRVVKLPPEEDREDAYLVADRRGILGRATSLKQLLKIFERARLRLVAPD